MSEREAFLQAIAANEDDVVVRLVFADWLDEHGEHEEAERQRQFTEAKKWLDTVCTEYNANREESWRITRDQMLEFGRSVSALESELVEVNFGAPNCGSIIDAIRDQIPAFWKAWSVVTGMPLNPNVEQKYYYESGFCCVNEVYPDTHLAGPIPEVVRLRDEERARRQQEELAAEEARERMELEQQEVEEILRQQAEEKLRQEEQEKAAELRQQKLESIQDDLEKDRP